MNRTVLQLTIRSVLGRRRALVLLALPAVLIGLATLARTTVGPDPDLVPIVVGTFGVGTLVPLLGLIAGTSVIAPEIEDRSIMYVLAKPVSRASVFLSKLAVAVAIVAVVGVAPVMVAAAVVTDGEPSASLAHGVGAGAAGIAYCSLFCMLPVVTRNAVFIGLAYALVWETIVGQFVPGARSLSVQQWSLSVAEFLAGDSAGRYDMRSAVDLEAGLPLLLAFTVGCTAYGIHRLRTVRMAGGID